MKRFAPIDAFFLRARPRAMALRSRGPVETHLYAALAERPPELRPNPGALASVWWSLKLRYWALARYA